MNSNTNFRNYSRTNTTIGAGEAVYIQILKTFIKPHKFRFYEDKTSEKIYEVKMQQFSVRFGI